MSRFGLALPIVLLFSAACSTFATEEPTAPPSGPSSPDQGVQSDPTAQNPDDFLAAERARLTLSEQKQVLLVEQHLDNAKAMVDRADLEGAAEEIARALEIEPDSLQAKQMLGEVNALLGRPEGQGALVKDLEAQYQLQVQQLRSEAEQSLKKGELLLSRGDYGGAVAELTLTNSHIRWAPHSIDWQGMEVRAKELLARAERERTAAEQAQRDEANKQARQTLLDQEKADRGRREAIVANLLEQSIGAFEAARYEEAMDYAEQVLRKEPKHEQAEEIRDAAFRAGRTQVREDYVKEKREQFTRWREDLFGKRIPWTDVTTLPDEEFWTDITARRAKRRGLDLSGVSSETDKALRLQLAATPIPGLTVQQEESLSKVIDVLRTLTGLPLVCDPAADAAATDAGVVFDINLQNPLTVEQALNIITRQAGEGVAWTVRNDAVLVTTKAKARGKPVIYNHDVQDLVFGLTDFSGPRIDRIRLLDEIKDDDGGGPFGGVGESPSPIDIQSLTTLIKENVEPGTWEEEGIRIDEGEGQIIIAHTPETQERVRVFLNDLRRFNSSLVTIDSKFMTLASNWIQEVGVDFRGLDNPGAPFSDLDDVTNGLEDQASRGLDNGGSGSSGANGSGPASSGFFYDDGGDGDFKGHLENYFDTGLGSAITNIGGLTTQITFLDDLQVSAILRLVEKSSNYQLVNDQVLSVNNSQRAFVSVVNQKAYIQDFDVEVAQLQSVADPQVNVLTEGVVLDVRPTIHQNRRYLTLEIQPTVAKVVALRAYSSTLGGNTAPVEFQLPELEVQSVFTTAVIPDGGSILLGGLSNIRNIERRAEIPWIAKIPLVGFLFKQEGHNDENKTLMILIKAHITDVREELAKIEAAR